MKPKVSLLHMVWVFLAIFVFFGVLGIGLTLAATGDPILGGLFVIGGSFLAAAIMPRKP